MKADPLLAVTLLVSWASDRYKSRTIAIACSSILGAIGYIIYLCKLYAFLSLKGTPHVSQVLVIDIHFTAPSS